jgi:hypothetical protein
VWKEWNVENDRLFNLGGDDEGDVDDSDVSEMKKRGWWWDGQDSNSHPHAWQHREAWETTLLSAEFGMNTSISKHLVDSMLVDVKDPRRFLPTLLYLAGDARVRFGMLWLRLWAGDASKSL